MRRWSCRASPRRWCRRKRSRADVGQIDYDPWTGRFTALLSVTAPGMAPAHARLSGRVLEMVELPVAAHRLLPGDVIGPRDLQIARLHAGAVRGDMAQVPAQAIGLALRHAVAAGAPLPLADLGRPMLVQKGDRVQMQLDSRRALARARGAWRWIAVRRASACGC